MGFNGIVWDLMGFNGVLGGFHGWRGGIEGLYPKKGQKRDFEPPPKWGFGVKMSQIWVFVSPHGAVWGFFWGSPIGLKMAHPKVTAMALLLLLICSGQPQKDPKMDPNGPPILQSGPQMDPNIPH